MTDAKKGKPGTAAAVYFALLWTYDPLELPLTARTYETRVLGGLFGALRYAAPDYWGRRVIQRHVSAGELLEIDYLLQSPDDRAGAPGFALSVEPPAPRREFNQTGDLAKLQVAADAVLADEDRPPNDALTAQAEELLLIGPSMGGARPKAVVEADEALWVAKINTTSDRWNNARVDTIGARDVLLVKRFDRERTASASPTRSPIPASATHSRSPRSRLAHVPWDRHHISTRSFGSIHILSPGRTPKAS